MRRDYSYSPSPPRDYYRGRRSLTPPGYYRSPPRDYYRGRRSLTPPGYYGSPPRDHYRGRRSLTPPGYYGGRDRDAPSSLLVRNLRKDCRADDIRRTFSKFGRIKDVYLPRDYYSGEPRGFGFVQYFHPADAADAKYYMDGEVLFGREVTVVFAEENRKRPSEMRALEIKRGRSYDRRSVSPRPYRSSPPRGRSRSRSLSYSHSPRSVTKRRGKDGERLNPASQSPVGSRSRSESPVQDDGRNGSRFGRRERSLSASP